jgi:tRNA pseudouridine55 synthase
MKISGILLLDKPAGMSSNVALHKARAMLGANKAGHAGTLDPLATGALPLAFGEATKTCTYMLEADKSYATRVQLGIRTDTADADGAIIETRAVPRLDRARIEEILVQFRGAILQRPPMYSALKHQGKALYTLARQGIEIARAERSVQIHSLELLEFGGDWLTLEVVCGTGTYVRSLVEDIGELLGCGAHVSALRRLMVVPFESMQMVSLDELGALGKPERRALLAPIDAGIVHLPIVWINEAQTARFLQAQRFQVDAPPGPCRVYGAQAGLLAVGIVLEDRRLGVVRMLAEVVQTPNLERRALEQALRDAQPE